MTARKPLVLDSTHDQQEQIQSGDTLLLQACVAGAASLNIPEGTAPTAPNDGDMWTTSAGLYVRIAGTTIGPLGTGGGGGGGATGALQLIGSFTGNGSSSSYTFSSIPQGYTDLVLVVFGRGTAASTQNVAITLNGVGGTSYDQQRRYSTGGSANLSTDQTLGGSGWGASANGIFQLPGTNATAGFTSGGHMEILGYSQTSVHKTMTALTRIISGATDGSGYVMDASGQFRSTSAITSLTAALASGNFDTGSIVALYGRGGTAGAAPAGSLTLLNSIAANGSTTTFAFTGIPSTYKAIVMEIMIEGGGTINFRFNNDNSGVNGTSGLYTVQRQGTANGSLNLQSLAQNQAVLSAFTGTGVRHILTGTIPLYTSSTAKFASFKGAGGATGSGSVAVEDTAIGWNNTAAITEVDIVCSSAPSAGQIRVYGLN